MADDLFHFRSLECFIRNGLQPDNPTLFHCYFELAARLTGEASMTKWSAQAYLQVAQTLLEVVADASLPMHWRQQCLDHLYLPIDKALRLAPNGRVRKAAQRLEQQFRWVCL